MNAMKCPKRPTGFTLIEIMIVIVIIGILAAIAIPAYNDYMIRARAAEVVNVSGDAKNSIAEYRITKGVMPTSDAIAGITNISTKYVSSLTIGANGVITVTGIQTTIGTGAPFGIILTPTYNNNAVTWTCTATGATQYAPSTCR